MGAGEKHELMRKLTSYALIQLYEYREMGIEFLQVLGCKTVCKRESREKIGLASLFCIQV